MADNVPADPAAPNDAAIANAAPARLADERLAPSTRDAYRRALRPFDEWLGRRPPSDGALADYLGVLFECGRAPASADTLVSAVLDRARREGASSVAGEKTVRALAAFRREGAGRGPGQVVGIVWRQANRMATKARKGTNRAAGMRDALLIRLMSDCLLRVGEAEALDVADLTFAGRDLRVAVRRSKTDQNGVGVALYAGPPTADAARRWLEASGAEDGPLFRPVNKAGRVATTKLTVRSIRDVVKRWAAGIEGRVSGHSLRVGSAQSLREAGATTPEILAAGRWKRVETMAHYTREQDAAAGAVARLRYGAGSLAGDRTAHLHSESKQFMRAGRKVRKELKRMRRESKRMRQAAKKVEKLLALAKKAA